jgi:outer membrane protein assembly factor BamE
MPVSSACRLSAAVLAAFAAAGCASLQSSDSFLGVITPYRLEIVQGNVVTQEQIERVKPGMTRTQVRDVMGSPLLADPFHVDRWDYVFAIRRQGAEPQQRSIVLRFEGDRLLSVDAPALPSERDFVASIDTFKSRRDAGTLALTDEQRQALPTPRAKPSEPAPAPAGPARDYPPLEPQS